MSASVSNDDEQHCSSLLLFFAGVKEDDECSLQIWRFVHVAMTNSHALFIVILLFLQLRRRTTNANIGNGASKQV
jgi:hypothetical protein